MSYFDSTNIQLFRERLSEKVHATILKGIVGGFEFTVLPRNLKELARKLAMKMCFRVLMERKKSRFDHSGLSRAHFSDNLSRNSCIHTLFTATPPDTGVGSFTSHKNQINENAVRRNTRFFVLIREE